MRTQFQVALFPNDTDPAPFATIWITAKMPLSAMVFALKRLRVTRVGRVEVTSGEEQTTFYHVVLASTQVKYDRAALLEEPGR